MVFYGLWMITSVGFPGASLARFFEALWCFMQCLSFSGAKTIGISWWKKSGYHQLTTVVYPMLIPFFRGFQHVSTIRLVVQDFATTVGI